MKDKVNAKTLVITLIAISIAAVGYVTGGMQKHDAYQGVGGNPTAISIATTSTSVALNLATVSTRVLATSTNTLGDSNSRPRVFASICNPSTTLVYLLMNRDVAASPTAMTTIIAAAAGYSACYEITDRNLYQGSVQASSTAAATVYVADYVQ